MGKGVFFDYWTFQDLLIPRIGTRICLKQVLLLFCPHRLETKVRQQSEEIRKARNTAANFCEVPWASERADAPKEEATALSPSDMAHNNNNNIVSPPLRQPYFLYPCPARGQPVHCTFELCSCLAHEKVESNEEGRIIDLTICSPSRRIVDK